MHGQVVEDDDIAGAEGRDEHLLDVGEKRGIVDRAVEDRGRGQAIDAEPRDNRMGLPMAARRVIAQAYASRTPTVAAQEIRGDARFVDEDVRARIVQGLGVLPPAAIGGDVRPSLLVGVYRFFLRSDRSDQSPATACSVPRASVRPAATPPASHPAGR